MPLSLSKMEDWQLIARLGGPVIDPMVLRCGEIFLSGAQGATDPYSALDLMRQNIHALGMFFDRLILSDKIPVFNYVESFDFGQNFSKSLFDRINGQGEILVDVDVTLQQYEKVRRSASAEVLKLYDDGGVPGSICTS